MMRVHFQGGVLDGEEREHPHVGIEIVVPVLNQDSLYRQIYGNGEDAGAAVDEHVYAMEGMDQDVVFYAFRGVRHPKVDVCEIEGCEEHA